MKLALAVALIAWPAVAVQACSMTGGEPPPVPTLVFKKVFALKTNHAYLVSETCETTRIQPVGNVLSLNSLNIGRIESIPDDVDNVESVNNPLSRGADLSRSSTLRSARFSNIADGVFQQIRLPSPMFSISLDSGSLTTVQGLVFPDLKMLSLSGNKISSIAELKMPSELWNLNLASNPITSIDGVVFPDSLKDLSLAGCKLTSVGGVKWPSSLETLDLSSNAITDFEISEADLAIFKKITTFRLNIKQTSCKSSSAKIVKLSGSLNLCVLTAGDTNEGPSPRASGTGSKAKESGSSSSSSRAQGAASASASASASSSSSSAAPDESGSATDASSTNPLAGGSGSSSGSRFRPSTGDDGITNTSDEDRTSGSDSASVITGGELGSMVLSAVIVVGVILVILIAATGYRIMIGRRRRRDGKKETDTINLEVYSSESTPRADDPRQVKAASSQQYLANDVRNDRDLIPFRIDQKDIALSKQIASGGFGVIYRGSYQGREVAIKQMLPDTWRDQHLMASFMDEIRLCSTLEHPKIVAFIGLAWSSLQDLSVIIEYMGGGDLLSMLQKYRHDSSDTGMASALPRSEWFEQWTPRQLPCKTAIAKDVAEAVVYLHSFTSPILHRDLKARNVLLDLKGTAKLSHFGISREMAFDETMTSEVGTAAWIAPEVLRGERYSEKADIYSFGVLLVEMDRGSHPYEDELLLRDKSDGIEDWKRAKERNTRESMSEMAHKNTRIAVLVSTGQLRPQVTSNCPPVVASLAARCLNYDPSDRPTAMEIFYGLRQFCRSLAQ